MILNVRLRLALFHEFLKLGLFGFRLRFDVIALRLFVRTHLLYFVISCLYRDYVNFYTDTQSTDANHFFADGELAIASLLKSESVDLAVFPQSSSE